MCRMLLLLLMLLSLLTEPSFASAEFQAGGKTVHLLDQLQEMKLRDRRSNMEEGNANGGYFGNESGNADQDVGLESRSTQDNRVREQIVQEVLENLYAMYLLKQSYRAPPTRQGIPFRPRRTTNKKVRFHQCYFNPVSCFK